MRTVDSDTVAAIPLQASLLLGMVVPVRGFCGMLLEMGILNLGLRAAGSKGFAVAFKLQSHAARVGTCDDISVTSLRRPGF